MFIRKGPDTPDSHPFASPLRPTSRTPHHQLLMAPLSYYSRHPTSAPPTTPLLSLRLLLTLAQSPTSAYDNPTRPNRRPLNLDSSPSATKPRHAIRVAAYRTHHSRRIRPLQHQHSTLYHPMPPLLSRPQQIIYLFSHSARLVDS